MTLNNYLYVINNAEEVEAEKVNKENGQKGAEEAHGEAAGRFGEGEGPEGQKR